MILRRNFYERDTLTVARELLGCFLVRKMPARPVGGEKKIIRAEIIETEAYIGEDDLACHASKGRTKRTEVMYGEAGHTYIYLVYGMYELLNIVTEKKDFPAAVLVRAVAIDGVPMTKTNGPGKLTRFLRIDRMLNGWDLTQGKELWIERPSPPAGGYGILKKRKIITTPRIGISYAKHCAMYPWRFVFTDYSK